MTSKFRNGIKVNWNLVWSYSIQNCLDKYRAEFPEIVIACKQFHGMLTCSVGLFLETGALIGRQVVVDCGHNAEPIANA